jgi:hypothetical protein
MFVAWKSAWLARGYQAAPDGRSDIRAVTRSAIQCSECLAAVRPPIAALTQPLPEGEERLLLSLWERLGEGH